MIHQQLGFWALCQCLHVFGHIHEAAGVSTNLGP